VDGFDFIHRESVRFSELDVLGHVNNAAFATYFENARLAYLGERSFTGMILARLEIDFRSPVRLGEEVEIGVRTARVGTKSFDLDYELRAGGRLAAQGRSVLVAYDYERQESVPLSDDWKRRLAA
jgi:acyl-CoA thioester hydrolase